MILTREEQQKAIKAKIIAKGKEVEAARQHFEELSDELHDLHAELGMSVMFIGIASPEPEPTTHDKAVHAPKNRKRKPAPGQTASDPGQTASDAGSGRPDFLGDGESPTPSTWPYDIRSLHGYGCRVKLPNSDREGTVEGIQVDARRGKPTLYMVKPDGMLGSQQCPDTDLKFLCQHQETKD